MTPTELLDAISETEDSAELMELQQLIYSAGASEAVRGALQAAVRSRRRFCS